MNFPWYVLVPLEMLYNWPVTLLLVLTGVLTGAVGKGRVRVIALTATGLLLLPLVLFGIVAGFGALEDHNSSSNYMATQARRHEVLAQTRVIGGLQLPAGTVLDWKDDAKTEVDKAELPGPTMLYGMLLKGTLQPDTDYRQEVELVEDTVIDGWPCRAGKINIQASGQLESCDLSRNQAVNHIPDPLGASFILPAGTQLSMSPGSDSGAELLLPKDHPLTLPQVGATLPGGALLRLYLNNGLRGFNGSAEAPVMVHGLAFEGESNFLYTEDLEEDAYGPSTQTIGVTGPLDRDIRCNGVVFEGVETHYIRIYTRDQTVVLTHFENGNPVRSAPIPLGQCTILPGPKRPPVPLVLQ